MKRLLLPLVLCLTAPAFAREFVINPALPEKPSPCVWDIDASWMKNATRFAKTGKTAIDPAVSCDGAVLLSISVENEGETKRLHFAVGLKSGRDKDGLIQFSLVDPTGTTVAFGDANDNLDEGRENYLHGTLKIKNKDLAELTSSANKSTLHITMTVAKQ